MSQQWSELEKYMEQNVRPMWEQQMAQIPDQMAALIAKTGNLPSIDIPDNERDTVIDVYGRDERNPQKKNDRNKTIKRLQAENKRWSVRKYVEIGIAVAIIATAIVCSIVFHMPS